MNLVPAALLPLAAALPAFAQFGPYTATDIGRLPGSFVCIPESMNEHGEVVGWCNFSTGGPRAFYWSPSAGMVQIGPAGYTGTYARDISDTGLIVGSGRLNGMHHVWIFDGADYTILPDVPGYTNLCSYSLTADAYAINDFGEVVCRSCTGQFEARLFLWLPQTGYTDLRAHGLAETQADLNNHGIVCGQSLAGAQAARWSFAGGLELLGFLPNYTDSSAALHINNHSAVVGRSTDRVTSSTDYWRAFLHENGFMTEIAPPPPNLPLPQTPRSRAEWITDDGVVVGNWGVQSNPDLSPWIWSAATGAFDLRNAPGVAPEWVYFTAATAVNARGQILLRGHRPGTGTTYDSAVVLTPQTAACYGNCDASTTPPILNIADFGCFLTKFAAGDPYANCDGSTLPPVLNIADFGCFLQRFAAGCP